MYITALLSAVIFEMSEYTVNENIPFVQVCILAEELPSPLAWSTSDRTATG